MPASKTDTKSKKDDTPDFDTLWSQQRTVDEKLDFLARAVSKGADAKDLHAWWSPQHEVQPPEGNPADKDAKIS